MARNNIYPRLIGRLEALLADYLPGDYLPGEQELAARFMVSKPTLRRAIDELVKRNAIRRVQGIGNMVINNRPETERNLVFLCYDTIFFAQTIRSFCREAEKMNYFASVVPLNDDISDQERIFKIVAARRPTGIALFLSPRHSSAEVGRILEGIPCVYLSRKPEGCDGNLVGVERGGGMSRIVREFYRQGCRRFALLSDANSHQAANEERLAGFLDGLRMCRIKSKEKWIELSGDPEKQERFYDLFFDRELCPDALCCTNDLCVGQFLNAMKKRQIDVSSLRISGYDHTVLAAYLQHDLITVEPPRTEMGVALANLLIRQIENPSFSFQTQIFPCNLIHYPRKEND